MSARSITRAGCPREQPLCFKNITGWKPPAANKRACIGTASDALSGCKKLLKNVSGLKLCVLDAGTAEWIRTDTAARVDPSATTWLCVPVGNTDVLNRGKKASRRRFARRGRRQLGTKEGGVVVHPLSGASYFFLPPRCATGETVAVGGAETFKPLPWAFGRVFALG